MKGKFVAHIVGSDATPILSRFLAHIVDGKQVMTIQRRNNMGSLLHIIDVLTLGVLISAIIVAVST
jgi:hypothetical protein